MATGQGRDRVSSARQVMMTCERCERPLRRVRRDYRGTVGGVPNVLLPNTPVYVCRKHGVQAVVFRSLDRVLGDIRYTLLERGTPFTGAEARFLRKYNGWTQADLAARVRVHKITVAKWECGAIHIGPAYQQLLYMLFKDPTMFAATQPPATVRRTPSKPLRIAPSRRAPRGVVRPAGTPVAA